MSRNTKMAQSDFKKEPKPKKEVTIGKKQVLIAIPVIIIVVVAAVFAIKAGMDYYKNTTVVDPNTSLSQDTNIEVKGSDATVNTVKEPDKFNLAQYTRLKTACSLYIAESNDTQSDNVPTDVIITEDISSDSSESADDALKLTNIYSESSDEMVEVGPIYMDDMLMARYVNYKGELAVIFARFADTEQTKATVIRKSDISKLYKNDSSLDDETNMLTDSVYGLLKCKVDEEAQTVTEKSNIIVKDTCERLVASKQALGITDESVVANTISIRGKSGFSLENYDRYYMQFQVTNGDTVSYVDLLIKLNAAGLVFDIDIL